MGYFISGHFPKGQDLGALTFSGPGSNFNNSDDDNKTPVSGFFFGAPFFFNSLFNPYTALVTGGIIGSTNFHGHDHNDETNDLVLLSLDDLSDNTEDTTDPTYRENQTETNAVPEPTTLALLASGLGLFGFRKKNHLRS
jgi:hypothetical protein